MTFTVIFNVNAQQWIDDSSCNKKASAIVNEAITSLANLEHLMAVGMAKAALVVDKNCECATLICLSFSDLEPQSALFPAAAAITRLAHSQSSSTNNAALAIPTAIKCSKLASEVMASFTIAEALLLHDESSIHC